MDNPKLTDRERGYIVSVKSSNYEPNPKGMGYELFHCMRKNEDIIAQIDSQTGLVDTYGSLLTRCIRVSLKLLMKEIDKNDIICSCSSNHLNSCIPIIVGLFLGIKVVPLDPSLSPDEMFYIIVLLKPKIIFASLDAVCLIEGVFERTEFRCEIVIFGHTIKYIKFNKLLKPIKNEDFNEDTFEPLSIDSIKDTALILFSTKSPGSPRGVCISHFSLMMQMVNAIACWNLGKNLYLSNYNTSKHRGLLTTLNTTTYFCITGITVLCCSLMTGITQVIYPQFDADEMWHLIDKYEISFVACRTHQAIQMYKAGTPEGVEGKSLKLLVTTNQPLTKSNLFELRKLFPRCFITNIYEQAEACGPIAMFNSTKSVDIKDQYENPTSCGRLNPGVVCKIVDPYTNKILGPKQTGELRYKTNFAMNGYFNHDLSSIVDKEGWIKTGDIGHYDRKGLFYVLDRFTDVFKYKNDHILPSVIEAVILEHPAVKKAVVLGVPATVSDKVPMGVVTLNKGMSSRVTESDIETYVNRNVPNILKLRGGLKILKKIPFKESGKPRRRELLREIEEKMLYF